MSTYIDSRHPEEHGDYDDCPDLVARYLKDSEVIRGRAPRTANGYYIDLRTFFRFLKQRRKLVDADIPLDEIDCSDVGLDLIRSVTTTDIYEFLYYSARQRGNAPATRARKLSSLKGFYHYVCNKLKLMEVNPTDDVDTPALKKSLPKYLSLSEGMDLLENVNTDFYERDYCIITLFLNCGMRLSELVNIDVTDIREDGTIRIIGKGNKERLVYLNNACISSLTSLLNERAKLQNVAKDEKALFVSRRTGKRISARRVQQIVEACLQSAGLSGRGYSPHKLRHTAATMMYQNGNVDMLALREILGHAHVSTTEIYTHLGTKSLKEAAEASPFASVKPTEKTRPAVRTANQKKDDSDLRPADLNQELQSSPEGKDE